MPTVPGEGGAPDPDLLIQTVQRLRKSGRDVRTVVLTLPDNPTGTLASAETVRLVCAAARELDLVVVSDEIYRDLLYRERLHSPAAMAPERVVTTTGLRRYRWTCSASSPPCPPGRRRFRGMALKSGSSSIKRMLRARLA